MTATLPPTVRRIPLFGTPCGVCGLPAIVMDIVGGWTRVWHSKGTATTTARYCDVGTRPTGGQE